MRVLVPIRGGIAALTITMAFGAGVASPALAQHSTTGGVGYGSSSPTSSASTPSQPVVPGTRAKIINGLAYAPAQAPMAIKRAIWAGDKIRHTPYIYGGGHGSFNSPGYDCSGSVSYVLHAAGLLKTPMDSSDLLGWGDSGHGQWITVYTNPGHAFVQIAGIRLDTSSEGDPHAASGSGPRWRPLMDDTSGYSPRHFDGF